VDVIEGLMAGGLEFDCHKPPIVILHMDEGQIVSVVPRDGLEAKRLLAECLTISHQF